MLTPLTLVQGVDVAPLADLTALQVLKMNSIGVRDVSMLSRLCGLKELSCTTMIHGALDRSRWLSAEALFDT